MLEIDVCPEWLLHRLPVPPETRRDVGLMISSVLALVAPLALIPMPHVCLIRLLLHVPCPGCGVMHALVSLLKLDPSSAWRANPGGLALGIALLVQIAARPIAMTRESTRTAIERITRLLFHGAALSLGLVWLERLISGGW